jgi:hypothetical protein|tara:strand:+ start:2098 stop:2403 length:306 start_codon:yes stop_codon:yes gene_type:complete
MALTYRSVKGSALTIDELDDNFRYFTGSHSITGSLIIENNVSASSIDIDYDNIGGYAVDVTSSGGFSTPIRVTNLPSVDPAVAGALWVDASANYVIKVSQG